MGVLWVRGPGRVILGGSRGGPGLSGSFGVSWPFAGRLPGRHPVRATARERISQFAEANSMCRWFRFLVIPR